MASLALGAVGAAIGGAIGGPVGAQIGWAVGSMVGSLIDPPKVQGPRLGDLKLQSATYGKMIPFVWGSGRISGNIIDQTDLEEHEDTSGGKGGPEVTTYTYSASFDIALCNAVAFGQPAIIGVSRIWADGRLIWSTDTGDEIPCTVYTGTETQLPDATFEAIHGVGEVPAYRGTAHAVFADYYLTSFGNRIPLFEFEVYTGVGAIPVRISTYDVEPPSASGAAPGQPEYVRGASIDGEGYVCVGVYRPAGASNTWTVDRYVMATGLFHDQSVNTSFDALNFASGTFIQAINDCGIAFFLNSGMGNTGNVSTWVVDGVNTGAPVYGAVDAAATAYAVYSPPVLNNDGDFIYAVGSAVGGSNVDFVARFAVSGRIPEQIPDAHYTFAGTNNTGLAHFLAIDEVDGTIWVGSGSTVGGGFASTLNHFSADLTFIQTYTSAQYPSTFVPGGQYPFVVFGGVLCFSRGTPDPSPLAYAYDINTSFTLLGSIDCVHGSFLSLGNGLIQTADGIISINPPAAAIPLATIVGDLSDMTPNTAYDVTDLTADVRWFVMGSQMTVRNAIEILRKSFFFDAVESDDEVRFVTRGGASIATIPDDDLCARDYGTESDSPLRTSRKREQMLPRTVTLSYIDVDSDYQTGAQSSPRLVSQSQSDVTLEVPIGFTATEALQKCWTLQTAEWMERETFEFSTTRKWGKLEPCDVVTVRGRVLRIVTKTESPSGVIQFTGVLSAASIYTQPAVVGSGGSGFVPPTPPGAAVLTSVMLLDLPLIRDTDQPNGHYAALTPAAVGTWSGANLYKSIDGGSSYTTINSTVIGDTVGTVAAAVGNFTGGNSFDETNVITVVLAGGTLVSASEDAVLNGANPCIIGAASTAWEVLQFKTATLVAANTYELSGLLRGRRGTEWAISTHAASEVFVLLPTTINVTAPFAELGALRKYKAVTFGKTLASAASNDFTNNGIALKPYAPSSIDAGRDGSGNLTVEWMRRSRLGGAWLEGVEVQLNEAVEAYRVRVYTTSGYATVAREITTSTETASYTAAEQTTDFGSAQATIYIDVAQLGSYGYGYAARGAV